MEGFRQSHIRDGAALARYFAWLEEALNEGKEVNEWQGAEVLENYRKELELFKGLSFTTISSTGPNGGMFFVPPCVSLAGRLERVWADETLVVR